LTTEATEEHRGSHKKELFFSVSSVSSEVSNY
jgi:hypothetical protein